MRQRAGTMTTAPRRVRWETLSKEGAAILRQVALPISCGLSTADVARRLKIRTSSVTSLLRRLADELEADAEQSSGATGAK